MRVLLSLVMHRYNLLLDKFAVAQNVTVDYRLYAIGVTDHAHVLLT